MDFQTDKIFSEKLDHHDSLSQLKEKFIFPKTKPIYFCGHSLGLQPKLASEFVGDELKSWSNLGVEGHMNGKNPWFDYHTFLTKDMANIVGAKETETVVMNSLTTNLHLLMISFFKPNKEKYKIIIDTPVFPSDKYAVQSQLKLHGLDPEKDLIEINTMENEKCVSREDMLASIEANIDSVAMMLLSGVNYYTGQLYDIKSISHLAKKNGCIIGLDLAHAAGNVKLNLNQWEVDFASWCGYKYLNGGPGAPSGIFVHEKHHNSTMNRLEGWWGHDKNTRFNPPNIFKPINSAEAWQLSNPPILSMAALRSSLEIFSSVGIGLLREKSEKLTGYLEYLIKSMDNKKITILTPDKINERGSQLSLVIDSDQDYISKVFSGNNIIIDIRKPNVIRAAPCALYNSFSDVYNFAEILKQI